MPAALVNTLAEQTGIDLQEAEKRWKKAKAIAEQETGLTEKDGEDFWKYVTGVFKKSMGIGKIEEAATVRLPFQVEETGEVVYMIVEAAKAVSDADTAIDRAETLLSEYVLNA